MNELNFKQELTAAFGQPISENPTQVMIEAAYQHHNLDWRYLTIEVGPNDWKQLYVEPRLWDSRGSTALSLIK
jgi:shikimate 5-dehydrogenase